MTAATEMNPTDRAVLPALQCPACALVIYPRTVVGCPRCSSKDLKAYGAAADGHIWTYTVQRFPPKSPPYAPDGEFKPFVVAYVQTEDGIRVEGIVSGVDPDDVHIGMGVRLASCNDVPRYVPADGGRP
ncbi:Zn-ribbon domain-containing OB-fold protein [Arthrobacter bambusae]|uniref:Zn-ribbon domain-containing OB-fold protein n=1 Tax=Arthrobacter bambusae TaxID=1338426 RepID=UPI002789DB15|nr:OB-fold domain-containing protein [Arthrobacter bambusae]MDQ0242102.1 putative OB-fold protein [Arthrobacter bambusae]